MARNGPRSSSFFQGGFVGGEQEDVVTVAQIGVAAQFPLDEVIQVVEVNIGPELAGLVADRQAPGTSLCLRR